MRYILSVGESITISRLFPLARLPHTRYFRRNNAVAGISSHRVLPGEATEYMYRLHSFAMLMMLIQLEDPTVERVAITILIRKGFKCFCRRARLSRCSVTALRPRILPARLSTTVRDNGGSPSVVCCFGFRPQRLRKAPLVDLSRGIRCRTIHQSITNEWPYMRLLPHVATTATIMALWKTPR